MTDLVRTKGTPSSPGHRQDLLGASKTKQENIAHCTGQPSFGPTCLLEEQCHLYWIITVTFLYFWVCISLSHHYVWAWSAECKSQGNVDSITHHSSSFSWAVASCLFIGTVKPASWTGEGGTGFHTHSVAASGENSERSMADEVIFLCHSCYLNQTFRSTVLRK